MIDKDELNQLLKKARVLGESTSEIIEAIKVEVVSR